MNQFTYERFWKYRVGAESVEDFLMRYYKPERLNGPHSPGRKERMIQDLQNDLEQNGFCFISRRDSMTGQVVAYYGNVRRCSECGKPFSARADTCWCGARNI